MIKNRLKVHFVGIKGVGQAALAIIAKEAGFKVTGSDIEEEFITSECLTKAGIVPTVGFSKEKIGNVDLLITTGAHGGYDNVEVLEAKKRGIKVISKGEALGMFMSGGIFGRKFEGISVAGSHGKTTLTAILATIFKNNNFDPSFLIGTGEIPSLGLPGHFGRGKFFIAEADEYATEPKYDRKAQFLWQKPKVAVFTNIELDHPDIYPNLDSIRKVFLDFANQLPKDGILVCCGDDPEIEMLLRAYKGKRITYGFSSNNDYVITKTTILDTQTFFWVESKGASLGEFSINISGEHNALNALGASIVAIEFGLPLNKIKQALNLFVGTKRRFEKIGVLESGAIVFDDYAHHPTEIQKTLLAFRKSFPKSKIVCIFQPHTYSRTKKLFEQFVNSFKHADTVILTEIFSSLREEPDKSVSSEMLALKMKEVHSNVLFFPTLSDVVKYVDHQDYGKNVVLITMGAGDIYKISNELKFKDR